MCVYLYTFFNLFPLICILQEKDARDIEIPNIRWEVFELMMRFIANSSFLSDLEKKSFLFDETVFGEHFSFTGCPFCTDSYTPDL